MIDLNSAIFALAGGIFPALLWLWFWLREDSLHPEPKRLVFFTFIGGAFMVVAVLPYQVFVRHFFEYAPTVLFFLWAAGEEVLKYIAAYVFGLRTRALDEPIDTIMYMITAALGFSAFENVLFLINPLMHGSIADTIITGSQRFVGASLLHVLCSSVVGIFMAFSFSKSPTARRLFTVIGIVFAIALHTLFNLSIIDGSSVDIFTTFTILWILVLSLLFLFEKVKRLKPICTIC